MASADNTVNNNNMEIQVYKPPQVGETAAAANPTNAADSIPTNNADSSTTISDNNNADSTIGWKWMWPDLRIAEAFSRKLFWGLSATPKDPCSKCGNAFDASQQVIKEGAEEDELWFLVSDKFVRFSKYEYALVTGLRFGTTNFDPNAISRCPKKGVFRKFVDPENKYGKKGAPYDDVLDLFKKPPKALRRSPEDLLKIAKVTYHIYGFSHAFLHFIFEAVPGLAANITSKPKHKLVQPRILKRLVVHIKTKDNILEFFDTKEPIECYETLEPTKKELVDYSWWNHVADDLRSSVKYIHRESQFKAGKAKDTALKRTREQSPVPAREQKDGSVPAVEELRQRKRARMTESPNVDPNVLFTKILEGVRRENELLVQRLMREMREIEERASRKFDDMRSEIDRLRKTVEELRQCSNNVPFEDYARFETTPPPPSQNKTPSPLPSKEQLAQNPKNGTTPPHVPIDEVFVPFDDNFCDEIGAFTDMVDYVRHQKGKDSEFKIRRAIRPTKDSDGTSFFFPDRNKKQMTAYLDYLYSDSKELRDIGNTVPETASFFKEMENPTKLMETPGSILNIDIYLKLKSGISSYIYQAIDAYLRILKFNPEFLGCYPEGKGKYTIMGHFFCKSFTTIFDKMYPGEPKIIPEEVKDQAEKLDPDEEQVEILLNLVRGKTKLYLTDKWAPLVPFTEVEKIYVVWLVSQHFYHLVIDLVKCEVWIFDSLSNSTNRTQSENRYLNTMSLRRILPSILMLSGFYDVRKNLKPLNREWDLRFGDKNYCFTQEDGLSCGPFSLKMMEVLVSRRTLPNIIEENMKFIRRGIAERIFSFSKP
ncbi:hypothetical protein CASFOL_036507 [Castilleja foliolosa]|uniref:Ubiquitin-like protease family profile domain-containing protein n=1 Tax=Castilleja foliolosa TaxID=1961234 RepID=A0ABD3BY62_9LAMI